MTDNVPVPATTNAVPTKSMIASIAPNQISLVEGGPFIHQSIDTENNALQTRPAQRSNRSARTQATQIVAQQRKMPNPNGIAVRGIKNGMKKQKTAMPTAILAPDTFSVALSIAAS